ncbi:hypothetical protein [Spiroplasma tabanidicola]|uniref:Uncharacterized protein n=1 Tax=Spiroplasma tabanidicola TaxID=324079 RepID=A0A6I6C662_9MOLU|nr:hypothetical protein [Spiroplasma tabanidicola]QGS51640.1 hypothetical protein STABA_v1c02740 [Spiroplasma tabanidicola]
MSNLQDKFPFCCKKDSTYFSTLLENYLNLRKKQSGLEILNNDYKIYKNLSLSNLDVLFLKVKNLVEKVNDQDLKQLEKKFWDISSILFIYYIKLVFQTILDDFDQNEFLNYIKNKTIYSQIIAMTKNLETAWSIIKEILDDIETYNNTILY